MTEVRVYEVTVCGHVQYLAGMKPPECPLCKDILREGEYTASLISGNPLLTIPQAREFARRIIDAELREDYIAMHAVIQEALYLKGEQHAA